MWSNHHHHHHPRYGMLQLDFALLFAFTGFCGSILGQFAVRKMASQQGKHYKIIFILAAVIGISCLLLTVVGAVQISSKVEDGTFETGFSPVCHANNNNDACARCMRGR